jgi:Flp pilus assembly protein protease CpaA
MVNILLVTSFLALMISDFKNYKLPNFLLLLSLVLILFLRWGDTILPSVYAGLASLLFGLMIYNAGFYYYKKEVFGMGDVKLFGVVGLYAGFTDFILIVTIASIIALIAVLIKVHHSKVPYGAYISLVMILFILKRII